jgi:hypothetical protein
MENQYITNLGNILPEITDLIKKTYDQKYFWDKNPQYRKINSRIFAYAILGQEYPTGILPDNEINELAEMMKANVKELAGFDSITKEEVSAMPFTPWARFVQNHISVNYRQKILDLLPEKIKKHDITFMIQIASSGQNIGIHQDHERSSGLFYLLTEPDAETRFYKPNKEIKFYKDSRSANIHDVDLEHVEVIQKNSWYAFNHLAYHSVHVLDKTKPLDRASFVIEFVNLPYNKLLTLLGELNTELIDTKV